MKKLVLSFTIFLLFSVFTFGQGCSDAGFCTMGAMKPDQPFHKKRVKLRSIEISQYAADVVEGKSVLMYSVDANVGIGDRSAIQIKLPYQFAYGPMGDYNGLGDISLGYTYTLLQKENLNISATVGTKIPTGDGNEIQLDGRTLPMFYQRSQGTFDLIFGASVLTKNWLFAAGYQQVLNQNNSAFSWGTWNDHPFAEKSLTYPTSLELRRGTDIMTRVERNFRFSNFNFSLGLLP
ncbi:MAG: hypothetical protein AAF740_13015, partial [Bacteroidota bacterium]